MLYLTNLSSDVMCFWFWKYKEHSRFQNLQGVATEREFQTLSQGKEVYRVMLRRK